MPIIEAGKIKDGYDLVMAGTGFGSLFFLHRYLKKRPKAKVLLVEWGAYRDTAWQLQNQMNSSIDPETTYVGQPGEKPWNYSIGYGGGTNCWWSHTPRLTPSDFEMKTRYGVGQDWPISYAELEPYYLEAEKIMPVAGPNDLAKHYPRSGPYPQPAHNFSSVDKVMKAAQPDLHYSVPCARLRLPIGERAACCVSGVCHLCPTGAKFTALNTFGAMIDDPRVDLIVNSRVMAVEIARGVATGLRFISEGGERVAKGELVAVGANGVQTPFILQRSGFKHPALGKYLHEKLVIQVEVFLDGLDNFDGGLPMAGLNLSLVDGEHRKTGGAGLIYFQNGPRHGLRSEFGRWRQTLPIEIFIEDLPQETNFVADEGGEFPVVRHPGRSDYCWKGADYAMAKLPEILKPLPVESIRRLEDLPTGSHVQGTVRMGKDPKTSVVDAGLVHHEARNLLVLGTAVFPTCGTANPSLTAAALSLRAAAKLGA